MTQFERGQGGSGNMPLFYDFYARLPAIWGKLNLSAHPLAKAYFQNEIDWELPLQFLNNWNAK